MNTVKPFRGEDCPVCRQTRDGEHCGEAYARVNFIPWRARRSMFGICKTGMREFSMPSCMGTGVPFHAQSSINRRTMFGFSAAYSIRGMPIKSAVVTIQASTSCRGFMVDCVISVGSVWFGDGVCVESWTSTSGVEFYSPTAKFQSNRGENVCFCPSRAKEVSILVGLPASGFLAVPVLIQSCGCRPGGPSSTLSKFSESATMASQSLEIMS